MHNQLLTIIKHYVSINDREVELCHQYFEPVSFPKNKVIEEEGKMPRFLYFVVSGYLRLFHYNDAGDEITSHINCPPGFLTSYTHFNNQSVSHENVECVTDCELLRISKADLDTLTQKSPAFKDFSIRIFQQSLAYNENRSSDLATLSAEQRYQKLIDEHPHILQQVPLQYIASFLGMNAKSLSRIRKQLFK